MAVHHQVLQGEHLSSIAAHYGYTSYKAIWDHPENAELKRRRQNPHVLYPGDTLYIPERGDKYHDAATQKRHHFVLYREPLQLRLKLERAYDDPLANAPYKLHLDSDLFKASTDGAGGLEKQISATAQRATVFVEDKQLVNQREIIFDLEVPIGIGHLDPVEEESGQRARLLNLGYYRGAVDRADKRELLSAVEEFQCDHALMVDGVCGPQTQAKLKQVHGC